MPTLEAKRVLGLTGSSTLLQQEALRFTVTAARRIALFARDEALALQVTAPGDYVGIYGIQPAIVAAAPVALTLPAIEGVAAAGETLSVRPALWIHDGANPDPTRSWQWRRDGADIAGATGLDYALGAADVDTEIDVVETLTAASGTQTYSAPPVTVAA